jgi:hypothetical protein
LVSRSAFNFSKVGHFSVFPEARIIAHHEKQNRSSHLSIFGIPREHSGKVVNNKTEF